MFGTDLRREWELAELAGVPAAAAFEAGVAGALCDPQTRRGLAARGAAAYS
jgi:aminodeoxyfutalosine deaminase